MLGPDFLLIGAMKSGTTSLFNYICQHPAVLRPKSKELHYYDNRRYGTWTLEDYLEQFPEKPQGFITGEATPFYLRHKHAPEWVANDFPDVKLIAVLRNPVERAYSHYQQRFRKGKEGKEFLEVLKIEDETMADALLVDIKDPVYKAKFPDSYSYLSRGLYCEQLTNWEKRFPKDRFHVLITEDLLASAKDELAKIFVHLQLTPTDVHNKVEVNTSDYPQMPNSARQWLENYYDQPNAELSKHLGRKLPW